MRRRRVRRRSGQFARYSPIGQLYVPAAPTHHGLHRRRRNSGVAGTVRLVKNRLIDVVAGVSEVGATAPFEYPWRVVSGCYGAANPFGRPPESQVTRRGRAVPISSGRAKAPGESGLVPSGAGNHAVDFGNGFESQVYSRTRVRSWLGVGGGRPFAWLSFCGLYGHGPDIRQRLARRGQGYKLSPSRF